MGVVRRGVTNLLAVLVDDIPKRCGKDVARGKLKRVGRQVVLKVQSG